MPGMVMHACKFSTGKVETGGSFGLAGELLANEGLYL